MSEAAIDGAGGPGAPDETRALDLRILTPGLSAEEVAAVVSVVRAVVAEQSSAQEPGESAATRDARRWRRAVRPFSGLNER